MQNEMKRILVNHLKCVFQHDKYVGRAKMKLIVFKNRFPVHPVNHRIKKLKMDGSAIYYLGGVAIEKQERQSYYLVVPSAVWRENYIIPLSPIIKF
jgi:hypothetical protein